MEDAEQLGALILHPLSSSVLHHTVSADVQPEAVWLVSMPGEEAEGTYSSSCRELGCGVPGAKRGQSKSMKIFILWPP